MAEQSVRWEQTGDGIVVLTIDCPGRSTNTVTDGFRADLAAAVTRLATTAGLRGVLITSAKSTFFAGGDLHGLLELGPDDAAQAFEDGISFKSVLRQLETLPVPVVAALNGSALGGGLEIAFATHHRIALRTPGAEFGLPEVTLGLLPGGGGVVRAVRLLGLEAALNDVLLRGQRYAPADALRIGLIDEVAETPDDLMTAARRWLLDNPDARQPWDAEGYRLPAATGYSDESVLPVIIAAARRQTKGAPSAAVQNILAAAVEGKDASMDIAARIETRYFVDLVTGQETKNLIRARFSDPLAVRKGDSRPADVPAWSPSKVAVLGAGMMGAGIAYQAAINGMAVVLKDVSVEAAENGKNYSRRLLDRQVDSGRRTAEQRDEVLNRIVAAASAEDCAGCDLVIEAVFEDEALKHDVICEIEAIVDADAVIASNTSTIPITDLARAVKEPDRFVGMHFFSPVDRMPLLELIRGAQTSDQTLARAFDAALKLGKTPIVVNDNRGFFTSRVIGTVVNEAVAMLGEGLNPSSIERAALRAGYPVGMLQLTDELNMELSVKVFAEGRRARESAGEMHTPHPGEVIIEKMVDLGRPGRLRGAGFYDYSPDGRRAGLWPEVSSTFSDARVEIPFEDMTERLLFIEAVESVRCLQENVLTSPINGNVGSVMGIGYPAWTGGVFHYINGYPGGPAGFERRADELAQRYGRRFEPPALLREVAGTGRTFS
jgi:3-hydroxyacyl-CoA dehydrogenase/enoyl-CoA hydratase/3-hydroxybutyryl-CoA epimerase